MAQKRKDRNGLISGFKASDLVFLDESGCNTDMTRRSPGCGSKRLPLALASCWPLPQQLLPVSATGGGRRRCKWLDGWFSGRKH